ncbi:MAG TPA: hypothetical protein VEX41_05470, partial [Candidatus Eisenbacteria bacterium]|nr:hypothetical protein [Candidatus Eisenbacteria bacterium]
GYRTRAPQKIGGVPPASEAIFEKLQPFAGANSEPGNPNWGDPEGEPLALLRDLSIWDKHRALNLTTHVMEAELIGLEKLGIYGGPVPSILTGYFKRGAVIARLNLGNDSRPPEAYVDVYLRTAFDIAFEDTGPAGGENLIQTLNHIRQEVRERVLPAFARFFPKR